MGVVRVGMKEMMRRKMGRVRTRGERGCAGCGASLSLTVFGEVEEMWS